MFLCMDSFYSKEKLKQWHSFGGLLLCTSSAALKLRPAGRRPSENTMLRSVLVFACIAASSAFSVAPAAPSLRASGRASLPLANRPVRVSTVGGATKLQALGNLFGLG